MKRLHQHQHQRQPQPMLMNGYHTDTWYELYRYKLMWAITSANANADTGDWCGQNLIAHILFSCPLSTGHKVYQKYKATAIRIH